MTAFEPVTLSGARVRLEPLAHRHASDLVEAVKDGELWRLWYTTIPPPEKMSAEIDRRLGLAAEGKMLPFAVIDLLAGTAVGMTTFLNIDAVNKRVEIGATWYRKRAQRTEINTQCKLLLLTHAFEMLDCIAVEFRTHFFNHPSRRGILRSHQRAQDGTLRDTCVYSIIASEWPTVKSHLTYQLTQRRQ
jgi:N-acetyltransferase